MAHGNKGKTRSPELRARISASLKGRKLSDEHRAAIGASQRGKKRPPFSAEWRANMGAAKRGKKLTPEHKAKISAGNKGKHGAPRPDMQGDRNPMRQPEIAAKLKGSRNGRYADVPSYGGLHDRLDSERGKATSHQCEVCDKRARQWALLHEAPSVEVDGHRRSYSLDLDDYIAMCAGCHIRYDRGTLSL